MTMSPNFLRNKSLLPQRYRQNPLVVDAITSTQSMVYIFVIIYVITVNPYGTICMYLYERGQPNVLVPGFLVYTLVDNNTLSPIEYSWSMNSVFSVTFALLTNHCQLCPIAIQFARHGRLKMSHPNAAAPAEESISKQPKQHLT